jgi:hypothetical protein
LPLTDVLVFVVEMADRFVCPGGDIRQKTPRQNVRSSAGTRNKSVVEQLRLRSSPVGSVDGEEVCLGGIIKKMDEGGNSLKQTRFYLDVQFSPPLERIARRERLVRELMKRRFYRSRGEIVRENEGKRKENFVRWK